MLNLLAGEGLGTNTAEKELGEDKAVEPENQINSNEPPEQGEQL